MGNGGGPYGGGVPSAYATGDVDNENETETSGNH